MKRLVYCLAVIVTGVGRAADEPPSYLLGCPPVTSIRYTVDASENEWLASNAFHVAMSSCFTNGADAVSTDDSGRISVTNAYRLVSAEAGFSWERVKPEYYLADRIAAPEDIDWRETYRRFEADHPGGATVTSGFLFNFADDDPCVYAAEGGVRDITWVLKDGTSRTETYLIGPVTRGRPKRIYWTDPPYNSPKISLQGKFVRFFGAEELVNTRSGTVTNYVGGVMMEQENVIVSGLYLDKDSMVLEARGELTGQVLMVYYDSGNYDSILCVQTLEICQPDVIVRNATIGSELTPDGRGYGVEGLQAHVTAGIGVTADDRGDYLYQHSGLYSYSPKHKSVFALRPTYGERWKAEIYWMETDPMDVQWPFEVDQYELSWPSGIQRFVRGDKNGDCGAPIRIPSDLTAELQTYQEPDGHARAVDANGEFTTVGAGKALLKLTGGDNVWFLPVESVLRSDTDVYTLQPGRVNVGEELTLRGGSASGVAKNARPFAANPTVPGYVYAAGTPNGNYDANLYGGETNSASSVYAVSANGDIEVWWSEKWKPADLPVAITVPVLPQVYRPVWPKTDEAPQIVIASQKGSANETGFAHDGAACFDAPNAMMALPDRAYFMPGEGTLMFWTRSAPCADDPAPSATNAPGRLLTMQNGTNGTIVAEIANDGSGPAVRVQLGETAAELPLPTNESPNVWHHVAVAFDKTGANLYLDGAGTGITDPSCAALEGESGNALGAYGASLAAVGREMAEVTFFSRCLASNEVAEAKYAIRTGDEADVTGYFSFREGEDLVAAVQTPGDFEFTFRDRVGGGTCKAENTILARPGAPMKGSAVVSGDATPSLYYRNDPKAKGYNPNDEHAFLSAGAGGYVAYALRCDLATADTPPPAVFVEYRADGKNRLQFYHVLLTNETWKALSAPCLAGMTLPGPRPIIDFPDPWFKDDYWDKDGDGPGLAYRDRKNQIWARAAGDLGIHMYYAMQEGFCFPSLAVQPAPGTVIPWLARLGDATANVLTGKPATWTWHIGWPKNVPTMKIGQTLTTAEDNLPEVWNARSVAVVYPNPDDAGETVMLSDPTVLQSVPFDAGTLADYGLSIDPNGGLVLQGGTYHFTDLPPSLSSRLYADATNKRLCFTGERVEKNAGATVLCPNVLSAAEKAAVRGLARAKTNEWASLVSKLAAEPVIPNASKVADAEIRTTYGAVDHYALTAMGGTNYVVLVENDATTETMALDSSGERLACAVKAGDPIRMHVFRVVPEYYSGRIATREDEVNLLSQQLSVLYTDPIGGKSDGFEFEWRHAAPNANGTIPDDYDNASVYKQRPVNTACGEVVGSAPTAGKGLTRFVVGQQGDTLANMVNTYWICRYRATENNTAARKTMGETWSAWCAPPALAEGWVQRVLNNVTPFSQRMTDLYANKAETAVSMIQQAGAPFTGDVALNQDNLLSVGLIQLYETILNKAESLSIANVGGQATIGVAKQLQLAVERLGDLYKVLGDEAYTDAKNPTIGIGETQDGWQKVVAGYEASSLFCFDNQVNSLLDEELCLLRGRSGVSAPTTRTGPYYNRLLWNFTKGITAGEVAYAVNYDIGGTETVALSEEQAARTYPQGHGAAYGHYLSALKGWYRLLRNPNFAWFRPSQTEMNVADSSVNVDYCEDAKFAEAAADLAKTAADVVDLSARKAWRDDGKNGSGYLDTNPTNSFGYGEWASRGGYGALVNWAVANSILPEDCTLSTSQPLNPSTSQPYTDKGLSRIDRGTVDELKDICESAAAIVRAVDRIDAGLNPLGLSDSAIPFDIAPGGASDGSNTHFEQVRDRAKTALANARKVLERAQKQGTRLRLIQEAVNAYASSITGEEEDFDTELISYYGTPYSDDIGPGRTYKQGYFGPDLIHYMWMDLDQYLPNGIENQTLYTLDFSCRLLAEKTGYDSIRQAVDSMMSLTNGTMKFEVTRSGFVKKPDGITGYRAIPGSIQEKYGALLIAYYDYTENAVADFKTAYNTYVNVKNYTSAVLGLQTAFSVANEALIGWNLAAEIQKAYLDISINLMKQSSEITEATLESIVNAAPSVVGAGLAVVTSPRSIIEAATSQLGTLAGSGITAAANAKCTIDVATATFASVRDAAEEAFSYYKEYYEITEKFRGAALALNSAYYAQVEAMQRLEAATDDLRKEIGAAEQVLLKREAMRKRQVTRLSEFRYNEMLFRRIRDKSLTRYSAAFDLAQKYVYMAAQAYDYETALKREDEGSGDDFKAKIVSTRSLGAFNSNGEPVVADNGDLGLSGCLAQMDANWEVLKPRLGINNPQPYTTWFSLRSEKFRILDGETGDKAWAKELDKYWVDDILSNAEFRRYCQPFQSQFGLKDKEPGLIIPFETTIDFAKNLFGNDLAGDDHAYDSSWYSTRIAAAGVWFDGYNAKTADAASSAKAQLAADPVVYLVPVGYDCLRAPGLADGTYWRFSVLDQVIAAPYDIGSYELDSEMWMPSMNDADWQGVDSTVKIRKHPSFRAYFDPAGGAPSDDRLDATRLIGRSVWNTRWLLVIPAGAMNADREKALSTFINGSDTNRDGKLDLKPVSDIKIGFKTYSQSGN